MTTGLWLWGPDAELARLARRQGLAVMVRSETGPSETARSETGLSASGLGGAWPFDDRGLIVEPGTGVPWDLVPAGLRFVERWELAAPLEAGGLLAAEIGSAAERERTRAIVGDLRVPVYASGLVFGRACAATRGFWDYWAAERAAGPDSRLAFLRALYLCKPLFLALPRAWLGQETGHSGETGSSRRGGRRVVAQGLPELVHVEIAPGRYVCCRPDEVAAYAARFAQMQVRRRTTG